MLRLYLLRHAKSSWSDPTLADFDRPLNKRGSKDAPKMGTALKSLGYSPDRILCSSSKRTKETLAEILPELSGESEILLLNALYEGNAPDYLNLIRDYADDSQHLMIIGHNTGMEEIALRLVATGDPSKIADMNSKFPTGALAVIDFPLDNWFDVTANTGQLVNFIKPRDLSVDTDEIIIKTPSSHFKRR